MGDEATKEQLQEVQERQASPEGDPVGTPEEVVEKQGGADEAEENAGTEEGK